MPLLLTILSVLALWAFLTLLVVGLLLVFKALEGIRTHLQRITMGVRAIEQETAPLGPSAEALAATLGEAGGAVEAAAGRLGDVDRDFDAAAPSLRPRS
jgi:hypothetical protein